MIDLAARHGVKYTGVIIENYEDKTDGKVEKQADSERFQYFGNMILHQGGELGYHGYNHQPLSLSNTDYGDVLPYNTWTSFTAMEKAMEELISFGNEMFPETAMSVYVPPSNVLSEEGRTLLGSMYPRIRTIASNYFPGDVHSDHHRNLGKTHCYSGMCAPYTGSCIWPLYAQSLSNY